MPDDPPPALPAGGAASRPVGVLGSLPVAVAFGSVFPESGSELNVPVDTPLDAPDPLLDPLVPGLPGAGRTMSPVVSGLLRAGLLMRAGLTLGAEVSGLFCASAAGIGSSEKSHPISNRANARRVGGRIKSFIVTPSARRVAVQ